ncbi:hypothetical protein ACO2Q8_16740 [Larkinella sp. VNQ87]
MILLQSFNVASLVLALTLLLPGLLCLVILYALVYGLILNIKRLKR